MKIKELICQGVGNSDSLKKFLFGEEYNLIEASKNDLTHEIFNQIYLASLYPAYLPSVDGAKIQGEDNRKVRLGITFIHGGVIYRFVKDVGKKAYSLSKYNKGKSDFSEISRDPSFIEKAFADSFKIPESYLYNKLYTINPISILKQFSEWKKKLSDESKGYFESLEENEAIKQKLKKLKVLEQEKKTLEFARSLEFELDGFQGKLFEINDKINKVKAKEEEIKFAANELNEYRVWEYLEEFPNDIEQRLLGYDKLEEKKNAEFLALDNKMENLVGRLANLKIEPVHKDSLFLLSAVFGIASLGLAMFFRNYLLVFLSVFFISLLLAGLRVISFFKKNEIEEKLNLDVKTVNDDRAVVVKKFDIETSIVRKFLKKVDAGSAGDALEMMKKEKELRLKLMEEKKGYEDLKNSVQYDDILKRREELIKEISAKEEKLKSLPSVSVDPNDLHREIEELKSEIGEENLSDLSQIESTGGSPKDPYKLLIDQTGRLLKLSADKLFTILKDSYLVNLKILSNKYFEDVKFGNEGVDSFNIAKKSKPSNLAELNNNENLVACFALQFTLLQLIARHNPIPIIVFGNIESKAPQLDKKTFLQAIGHLCKSCQVLHVV